MNLEETYIKDDKQAYFAGGVLYIKSNNFACFSHFPAACQAPLIITEPVPELLLPRLRPSPANPVSHSAVRTGR